MENITVTIVKNYSFVHSDKFNQLNKDLKSIINKYWDIFIREKVHGQFMCA
jgi:hypothetical protein